MLLYGNTLTQILPTAIRPALVHYLTLAIYIYIYIYMNDAAYKVKFKANHSLSSYSLDCCNYADIISGKSNMKAKALSV